MVTQYRALPVKKAVQALAEVIESDRSIEERAAAAKELLAFERNRSTRIVNSRRNNQARIQLKNAREQIALLEEQLKEARSETVRLKQELQKAQPTAEAQTRDRLNYVLNSLLRDDPKPSCGAIDTAKPASAPTVTRFDEEELAAVRKFAEGHLSVAELETALQPFLKVEWTGEYRDAITAVRLAGAEVKTDDQVPITLTTLDRVMQMAKGGSPRDRQFAKEFAQFVPMSGLFALDTAVLKELHWLRQLTLL